MDTSRDRNEERAVIDALVELGPVSARAELRRVLEAGIAVTIGSTDPKVRALLERYASLQLVRSATDERRDHPYDSTEPAFVRRERERRLTVTIALVDSLEGAHDRLSVSLDEADSRRILVRLRAVDVNAADIDTGLLVARQMYLDKEGRASERGRSEGRGNTRRIRATVSSAGTAVARRLLERLKATSPRALVGFPASRQVRVITHTKDPRLP